LIADKIILIITHLKHFILLSVTILVVVGLFAQKGNSTKAIIPPPTQKTMVEFTYDAAGNRILRKTIVISLLTVTNQNKVKN
jgi:hypothetical protein